MRRRTAQRGVGVVIFLVLLLIIGAGGIIMQPDVAYFERVKREEAQENRHTVNEAKRALTDYMLVRVINELKVAQGATAPVHPRLLMLPCPDNVSDSDLDGSQEGSCRELPSGNNLVNDILDGGSRFGRLPWRTRNLNVNHSLNDGIDIDLRDTAGNRLWYALSRNLAPAQDNDNIPLNLHRLITHDEEWLTVLNQNGEILSDRVAAVVLAPGASYQPRLSEDFLKNADSLSYSADVRGGLLSPDRFLDTYTVSNTQVVSNHSTDGVFIMAEKDDAREFNDKLAYFTMQGLVKNDNGFVAAYKSLMGISKVHNAPYHHRPLSNAKRALAAYYSLLGFYPTPARQQTVAHVSQRLRHCAQTHSGDSTYTVILTVGTAVSPVRDVTVFAAAVSQTVTLANRSAFLLNQHAAVSGPAAAVVEDIAETVATITLARYVRITLDGALLTVESGLQSLSMTQHLLPAATPATLVSVAVITIAPQTPLRPVGNLIGWLADHTLASIRAGDNGQEFVLQADTKAAFFSSVYMTTAVTTEIVDSADVLTLAAGDSVRLEQDFDDLPDMNMEIFYQDGQIVNISNAKPTTVSYKNRQFAVWLLADALRGASAAVSAPALLFPWREKITDADSRDNLHDYPPCHDSRNFFTPQYETVLQDQNIIYAVSEECHYGGDPSACGTSGGFTVSVAANAAVALPNPVTLTHSYNVTVGNFLTLSFANGVLQNPTDISLRQQVTIPILDSSNATLAAFWLPAEHTLISGATMVLAAQSTLIAGDKTVFENVPALMIYSPAPLPRAACAFGSGAPPTVGLLTLYPPAITLVNQQAAADDITDLCYWLDDEENADKDEFYVIYPPEDRRIISPRNDYFMLLGGNLKIG